MVIYRVPGTFFSECEYVDNNIHSALERHDELERLMNILCSDNPDCAYRLKFKVEGNKFINNVKIYPIDESNGVGDTSDTSEYEVAKSADRRDC